MFNWLTNKKMIASLNSTIKATSDRNNALERELRDLKYSAEFNKHVVNTLSTVITELKTKLPLPPVQICEIIITYDNGRNLELAIYNTTVDKEVKDKLMEWFRTGKTMIFEVNLNDGDRDDVIMLQWSKVISIRFTMFTNNK